MPRGRKRIPDDQKRRHAVTCRLTDSEVEKVDGLRGQVTRGEFIRRAALLRAPRPIPTLNLERWQELARTASNLNQISAGINSGKIVGVTVDLTDLRAALDDVRAALIGLERDERTDDG